MAAMEALETLLQSLQALKAPGVTKTKIDAITAKCVENVQSDSAIVQKIVHQFKLSQNTHKLGLLYVVDSVTRQWVEKAKAAGQAVSKNAAPGTFASGVQKVTDVLPSLMTELVQTAPEAQKEKISKLLDIWERGQTFPQQMLAGLKHQLKAPQKSTYTPPGSPPKSVKASFGLPTQLTNHQPAAPPAPSAPVPAPQNPGALLAALASLGQQGAQANPAPPAPPVVSFQPNFPPPPMPGFMPPPPVATAAPTIPAITPEIAQQLITACTTGLVPQDQVYNVLSLIAASQQQAQAAPMMTMPPQPPAPANLQPVAQNGAQPDRFEQNGNRYRDRSRSPDYNQRRQSPARRSPPNRRDSPTYGTYEPNAGAEGNSMNRNDRERERGRGRGRNRGRGRDEYRQRSPPRRQPSPGVQAMGNGQPKFLEWDPTLPRDNIRVLSRTLFIGGASGTEGEIRSIFSRFGKVQTCIVNQEKRHAFVKMVNRHDAIAAKEGMDNTQDANALTKARQTRWGVGFGPRDCSDYATGVSVIPISRLTDADRKWVVTAEYGGTGGQPLQGGMVIEEPDIEIGAGVSSKAISRRVPPDVGRHATRGGRGGGGGGGDGGGGGGHDFQRGGFENGGGGRFRKQHQPPPNEPRHISPRAEHNVAVPPAVPGFGFQLPGF